MKLPIFVEREIINNGVTDIWSTLNTFTFGGSVVRVPSHSQINVILKTFNISVIDYIKRWINSFHDPNINGGMYRKYKTNVGPYFGIFPVRIGDMIINNSGVQEPTEIIFSVDAFDQDAYDLVLKSKARLCYRILKGL